MSQDDVDTPLRLFEGYGVELEYMLVRSSDLSVLSVSDDVLRRLAGGATVNEIEVESISWSNEFVMHVIELKNTDPAPSLAPLGNIFFDHVKRMNALLDPMEAMLLPSGMHPFMHPPEQARIWPHDARDIYDTFHRIFDCKRHGWANLQSVQLNLSFGDDDEFGKLHAAIRVVLPLLPALAASSPVMEGKLTGMLDTRLEVYRTNSERVPSIAGRVVPEPVFTESDYEQTVFEPMYREIEPLDPENILRHQWLNARGAIAQFSRDAIEIRVLDMQESPHADVAICRAVTALLRALTGERWTDGRYQRRFETEPLAHILREGIRDAERAVIDDRDYLRLFDFPDKKADVRDLWLYLSESLRKDTDAFESAPMKLILKQGPLARRLLRELGSAPGREDIERVYRELARCLAAGESFHAS